ncbi:hypothetical protein COU89_02785 [Candidatus Roizmanbacteria bacterium CG10_big_fil_rev_8_21_14_0_10_45_7]|uniref:DUF4446 domain-containing protein n=1 Tax=Candidatus Roizmanbacteria bacterium CG10_big_fil_rev_8_21_14_0_10_45_7 TaxID=1974854 RepID=A0A2M8KUD7_9BACT|nr:MAG: hypothetical protein COU89_02785 [Candidatus Roizmanbacteria bacterium CG10_big_fil_rev_8_21_14_0_10_45_7]
MNGIIILLLVWNLALTAAIIFFVVMLKNLFPARGRGMKHLLDEVFGKQETLRSSINKVETALKEQTEKTIQFVSRYGLVRFNPFERLGGEQSYCLALLNEEKSGIILTFLYSRDGMRVYLKEVVKGKGKDVEISEEEKKAIVKAGVL